MNNLVLFKGAHMGETPKLITAKRLFDNEKVLLTSKELSKRFSVPITTLSKWMARKEIPFYRFGRSVRFDGEEIAQWLAERKRGPDVS